MDALLVFVAALSATADGYAMARSDHFLVNAPSRELAEEVGRKAEALREEIALGWLGQRLPAGQGEALINVRLDDSRDEGTLWPAHRPGQRAVLCLKTSRQRVLGSTLAHEMTHVVLGARFGDRLPVWAQEGAAGLRDDPRRKATRRRLLAGFESRGAWPSLRETLDASQLAPTDQSGYTAAVGLTEFLLARGSRERLLAFAVAGPETGWDRAARDHYAFASLRALELAWRSWTRNRLLAADHLTAGRITIARRVRRQ